MAHRAGADRKCVGTIGDHDAELCAGLAVAAVLETRLRDLYAGNDRATELTLTCGAFKAVAGARKYVPENWNDGRVEVKVRAATDRRAGQADGGGQDVPGRGPGLRESERFLEY